MPQASDGLPSEPTASSLVETLSAIEHDRWSHWQRYLHSKCVPQEDGSLTIPAELVRRWTKQMDTPYSELSEAEKDSDREHVWRYLPTILEALSGNGATS